MNREIHIFFASSMNDLKAERVEMGDYMSHLNEIFRPKGLQFCLDKREYMPISMTKRRTQDECNDMIRSADYFLIMFYRKAGEYTREEFDVAYKGFQQNQYPRIITYFKEIPEGEREDAGIQAFKEYLDHDLKHFYSSFSDINEVKLGILLEIARNPSYRIELSFRDGKVFGNDREIEEIHLDRIACYFKNETINRLRSELWDIRKKYLDLKEEHISDPGNEKIFSELMKAANIKNKTEEQLHEVEMGVLEMASNIRRMTASGEPLSLQAERAIRLFENGECEKAGFILNDEERRRETERLEEKSKPVKMEFQMQVKEIEIKIGCLSAQGVNRERERQIGDLYEEACTLTMKHNLDEHILYAYMEFLVRQRQIKKAIRFGERGRYWLLGNECEWEKEFYLSLMDAYIELKDFRKAEEMLREVLERIETEAGEHVEEWKDICRMSAFEAAVSLYWEMKQYKKAREYTEKVLAIGSSHEEIYSEVRMANSFVSMAAILSALGEYREAMQYYQRIFSIHGIEDEVDLISQTWNDMGGLYLVINDSERALECFFRALEMLEKLAEENPGEYEHYAAIANLNVAKAYGEMEQNQKGLEYGLKALRLCQRIDKDNPDWRFYSSLYHTLSSLYYGTGEFEKSRQNAKKALREYSRLPSGNRTFIGKKSLRSTTIMPVLIGEKNSSAKQSAIIRKVQKCCAVLWRTAQAGMKTSWRGPV